MTDITLRFGEPRDAPVLAAYEREHFPAREGEPHGGYVYADAGLSTPLLTEAFATPRHTFTVVAERQGMIVGFATTAPFALPGMGEPDPAHMLLQYLAVDPAHRRHGVGTALIKEMERRALAIRQNVMVAHISTDAAHFYRGAEWDVLSDARGYAWLPFMTHLRADIADPGFGFPLMAAKVLRPRAIRLAFDFPIVQHRPMLDAAAELLRMVEDGMVDAIDLDEFTRSMVDMARGGPPPRKLLDAVDSMRIKPWR